MAIWMETRPEYRRLLADNEVDSFDKIMSWRGGPVRSKHRERDTVRVLLFDGDKPIVAFLKRNYRVPAKSVVADWLGGQAAVGQPIKESAAIQMLQNRGIGVMEAMAFGQRTRFGWPLESFILVRAVPAENNIEDWLRTIDPRDSEPSGLTKRRAMLYQLGELIWRIQRAHLSVPDLMAKHVYAAEAAGGAPGSDGSHAKDRLGFEFYLIDVERVTESDDVHRLRAQLKTFIRSLASAGITSSDLMRFVRGYLDPVAEGDRRAFRLLLGQEFGWAENLVRRLRVQLRSASQRPDTLPSPADDEYVRFGKLVLNRAMLPLLQQNRLTGMTDVFNFKGGVRLDKPGLGYRERIRATLCGPDSDENVVFLKRYSRPPILAQIGRILSGEFWHGTAWREFKTIRELSAAGIPTMRLVAVGEKMRGPIERRSFIATEAIRGESLEQWVPRNLGGPKPAVCPARRHEATRQLARLVQQMHMQGLCHRDLYLSHMFITFAADGHVCFRLIDLQRVHRFRPWRRRRWLVKDLASLDYSAPFPTVTATDRIRFLKTYLGVRRLDDAGRKWISQVQRKAERIARHNRAR